MVRARVISHRWCQVMLCMACAKTVCMRLAAMARWCGRVTLRNQACLNQLCWGTLAYAVGGGEDAHAVVVVDAQSGAEMWRSDALGGGFARLTTLTLLAVLEPMLSDVKWSCL